MSFHSTVSETAPAVIYGDGNTGFANEWQGPAFNYPATYVVPELWQDLSNTPGPGTVGTHFAPPLSEEDEQFLQKYFDENAAELARTFPGIDLSPFDETQDQLGTMEPVWLAPIDDTPLLVAGDPGQLNSMAPACQVPVQGVPPPVVAYDEHEYLFSGQETSSDSSLSTPTLSSPESTASSSGSFIPSQSASPAPRQTAFSSAPMWHAGPPQPLIAQQVLWPNSFPVLSQVVTPLPYAIRPAPQAPPLYTAPSLDTASIVHFAPQRQDRKTNEDSTTSTGGKSSRSSRDRAHSGPSRQATQAQRVDVVTAASGVPRQRCNRQKDFDGPREVMEALTPEDHVALKRAREQIRDSPESKLCTFKKCAKYPPYHDTSSRDRHIKEVHLKMNEVPCPYCGTMLKRKSSIPRHLKACDVYKAQMPVPEQNEDEDGSMRSLMAVDFFMMENVVPLFPIV